MSALRDSDSMEAGFEAGDLFRQLVDQALQGNHRQSADASVFGKIDAQRFVSLLQFPQLGPCVDYFAFVVECHRMTSITPLVRSVRPTAEQAKRALKH